jgi:hypothetical protein
VRCVFAQVPLTCQSVLTPPEGATPVDRGPLPLHEDEVALGAAAGTSDGKFVGALVGKFVGESVGTAFVGRLVARDS